MDRTEQEPYRMPERFATATVHFLHGLSEPGMHASVEDYVKDNGYALCAELAQAGFKPEQIEAAVNSGLVHQAPVFNARITDLYWSPEAEGELDDLARKAEAACSQGCDVVSLGGELESQQSAIVAIAFAAHKGQILETPIMRQVGPLFVSKDSQMAFLAKLPQNHKFDY